MTGKRILPNVAEREIRTFLILFTCSFIVSKRPVVSAFALVVFKVAYNLGNSGTLYCDSIKVL